MGKVDDQRAMREARYASRQRTGGAAAAGAPPRPPAARPPAARAAGPAPSAGTAPVPADSDELCGHRSIGNKSCTREKGHQANGTKNHRYA